ncbi:MAG: RES family NAD+ phosphorylase [Candidatus Bathyarchaeota archaeon]|uniref:RES family NAD+ phosphorylase n=1 Tax=Candidatus Bathycorpusculum sp. TaxID=2994959 RepID=UPI002818F7F1|nr:RES family NAD+ phosphorylase [Candidatus Termiticorpusculum sp.]MCL2257771.1 RES family NAD+ phosphorylase [Candidatus Termiticorpusculum sp.]MCL2292098.1 RES family NAD+ phosphorylase [Candidatus Termiticorpusculum sp.]
MNDDFKLFVSILSSELWKDQFPKREINIWDAFEKEIAHNRFFPETGGICDALNFYSEKAVYTLQKGKTIFRARLIKSMEELPSYEQISKYYFYNWDDSWQKCSDGPVKDEELSNESGFWGFDAVGSDAPPTDKASAGRINPAGISYLYAAEDSHTAIVEVRPTIKQRVSVAKIEIKKDLLLFDFCADLADSDSTGNQKELFCETARRLSMPNYVGDTGYYATQYIAQYIKKLKGSFDGIRFQSSLCNGKNIVLFDTAKDDQTKKPQNYDIKNSHIHYIDNIIISEKEELL